MSEASHKTNRKWRASMAREERERARTRETTDIVIPDEGVKNQKLHHTCPGGREKVHATHTHRRGLCCCFSLGSFSCCTEAVSYQNRKSGSTTCNFPSGKNEHRVCQDPCKGAVVFFALLLATGHGMRPLHFPLDTRHHLITGLVFRGPLCTG